jgi:hypothetical protein
MQKNESQAKNLLTLGTIAIKLIVGGYHALR